MEFDNQNMDCENKDSENMSNECDNIYSEKYGAIYIPGEDGKSYSCIQYDDGRNPNGNCNNENENPGDKKSVKRNSITGLKRKISIVALAVLFSILISAASAIAASFLTRNYYVDLNADMNSNNGIQKPVPPENNHVFVDKSEPQYSTQNKAPGEKMNMEEAILSVKDSVVEITTESVQSGFGGFSQYVVSGAGSGVIISTGGYIITNNHVIEGSSNIIVRLTDGSEYTATLIATDPKTDVAVISITPAEGVTLTSAVIGRSDNLALGQTVIAIGNPMGKLGGTVTNGIISSLAREIAIDGSGTMSLLQTNAAVSPGNSGGGLFDLYGRLVGIVNAKSTGEGVEGISFAIPINTAWDVAQQLIDKGYVSGRPSIGATIKQVLYGHSIFGESYYQLVVTDPGDTELKEDDIILSIDNIDVSTINAVSDVVSTHKIGDKVIVTVRRDKRYIDVEVTLIEYQPAKE